MTANYADTGVLLKSYVLEADSDEAEHTLREMGAPFCYSLIHGLEVPNAVRLKVFRREITAPQASAALRAFRADLDKGLLERSSAALPAIFLRAEKLSEKHSAKLGTRSLDLLHVAAALESGCKRFASLDGRQRECAKLEKLELHPPVFPLDLGIRKP
jgi:predicted nucleic acid-binding protein